MTRSAPTQSLPLSLSLLLPLSLSLLILSPALRWNWRFFVPVYNAHLGKALVRIDSALPGLLPSVGFAIAAYYGTLAAVGACRHVFLERGFRGRDLLKPQTKNFVPETLGLPAACIYLLVLFLFIPFRYYVVAQSSPEPSDRKTTDGGWYGDLGGRLGFPHHELSVYLSALLSLLSSLILGFCDDVFDIRWRFKIPIPIVASIPMLLVYYAGQGGTGLVVPGWPLWLRTAVGANVVDLGIFYYVFISLLSTFCTHSINILAGINGVEVGQALIIATSLCFNDAFYLPLRAVASGSSSSLGVVGTIQSELLGRHLFSLSIMLPFVGTCAGLLAWNRHPALVFVGDTFCYIAGQALACAGVLGHFSKTLLLFFLPQVFNFLLSCPQLFGFVPCPRHRVPTVHRETMSLYPSIAVFSPGKPPSKLGTFMLLILEQLRLVILYRQSQVQPEDLQASTHGSHIVGTTNLTLLNTLLVVSGVRTPLQEVRRQLDDAGARLKGEKIPKATSISERISRPAGPHIDEPRLWRMTMGVQLLGSALAFAVRYWAAAVVFPQS